MKLQRAERLVQVEPAQAQPQLVRYACCISLMLWAATPLLLGNHARADDTSFQFEAVSPRPYTAGYLGNGAIGLETTPLGTQPARCFLADVYDHSKGDVPRIASAPAWNEIDIYNGAHWLNGDVSFTGIETYSQILDMYDGVLRTNYLWVTDNRKIRVQAETFVSRDRAETAATRVTITPEFAGRIRVRLPLHNWPAPKRYLLEQVQKLQGEGARNPWAIWYAGQLDVSNPKAEGFTGGVLLSLIAHAPGYGPKVGEAIAAEWTARAGVDLHKESDGAYAQLTLDVKPRVSYTFTKFVALITSPGEQNPDEAARKTVLGIRQAGWQTLLSANSAAWHKLWETDIVVDGDPQLQRTIHSMLFYLLGSAREGLNISTPPMGLSSGGYYGHIFWDADTYLFPPLLILHPEIARPMVLFRSRTREAARRNARLNGYQGAMYPWEAGPDGTEATPRFAGQNARFENHVNGDVAVAAWQYWVATGDRAWLEHDGWPILRDTADFWVSRVNYDAKSNRYEIGKVVAVNESLIGVSNDAYTNAVARKNLELAISAARALHLEPHSKWREVSAKLYVPASDSSMLWFPLDLPFSPQQTRSAVNEMSKKIQRGETGAMMGVEFYPILEAQLGDRLLIGKMLEPLWRPYLRPPFQAIAETPQNQNTNFITGAGAFLQQFVFGYTGLRLKEGGLEQKFHPVLPPGVDRLTLRNITVRGKRETLTFNSPGR